MDGSTPAADPLREAHALTDELRARAREIEAARRLPGDLVERFAAAGFYRMCVPEAYGGLELAPAAMLRVLEALAQGDGSAAWCAFIGATSGATLAYLPEASAREIFASPTTRLGGVFAPRGEAVREAGGYRLAGRWAWGSGTQSAHWILAGCRVAGAPGQAGPGSLMLLVPAAEVEFLDTWHVAGLCGTGSTDFVIRDRRVPAERALDLTGPPCHARPLYAFPAFGLLALGIGAVALGLGRAAVDALVALASGKTPEGSRRPLAARSATQAEVARAEAELRAGRALLFDAVEEAWGRARSGDTLPVAVRRDLRLATTHAVEASVRAVDRMYVLGGGSSVYLDSPLQRIFRDAHVLTQHMMVAPPTWELAGRLLLGIDTDTTLL